MAAQPPASLVAPPAPPRSLAPPPPPPQAQAPPPTGRTPMAQSALHVARSPFDKLRASPPSGLSPVPAAQRPAPPPAARPQARCTSPGLLPAGRSPTAA